MVYICWRLVGCQAAFGRLSGGVHPGSDAQRRSTQSNTLHVGRREADRRAVSPDGYRSEGTPSPGEGPDARGETFWFLLGRLPKGTRCKSETISGRYRRNGYVHHSKSWSAFRPPSLASQLLQGNGVHLLEIGRLSGRLPGKAVPTIDRRTPAALHHSSGRALARLQLLILIHPPLREAEWRCSSGEWRVAPFDSVEHAACRSKRSQPEGSVPGWIPERRNAEPRRGAGRSGRDLLVPFGAFAKRDSL